MDMMDNNHDNMTTLLFHIKLTVLIGSFECEA